jgi:hypothetical protein
MTALMVGELASAGSLALVLVRSALDALDQVRRYDELTLTPSTNQNEED